MRQTLSVGLVLALACSVLADNFTLVADYSGNGFFDQWQFYGNYDNLTNGALHFSAVDGAFPLTLLNLCQAT